MIQGEKNENGFTVQSHLLMFVSSAIEETMQMLRSSFFFTWIAPNISKQVVLRSECIDQSFLTSPSVLAYVVRLFREKQPLSLGGEKCVSVVSVKWFCLLHLLWGSVAF